MTIIINSIEVVLSKTICKWSVYLQNIKQIKRRENYQESNWQYHKKCYIKDELQNMIKKNTALIRDCGDLLLDMIFFSQTVRYKYCYKLSLPESRQRYLRHLGPMWAWKTE